MKNLTKNKKTKSILKALATTLNDKVEGNIQRVENEMPRAALQRVTLEDPPP